MLAYELAAGMVDLKDYLSVACWVYKLVALSDFELVAPLATLLVA